MRIPITISIEERLVEQVDQERGLATRSRYVEMLLAKAVGQKKGGSSPTPPTLEPTPDPKEADSS